MNDNDIIPSVKADPDILAMPPYTAIERRRYLGADGRICSGTVRVTYGSPVFVQMPEHPDDAHYSRPVLHEEPLAMPSCGEVVDQAGWTKIREGMEAQAESVKESAAKARATVGVARADAIATLAKNAGLTAEQTGALFGRSLSPVVKEVVKAVAKKR
jgi:hypothetical protein